MGDKSKIEWTESTWNPVTGCNKVSPGCKNCYAEKMAHRLQAMGQERYKNGFALALQEDALSIPLGWCKPRKIFVNSMSDLFHSEIPDDYILRIYDVMMRCPQHTFQVLTKRAWRMADWTRKFQPNPLPNVWHGVSVENDTWAPERIYCLGLTPSAIRFLSCEPLLGPINFRTINSDDFAKIDWVIVGGESGPGARPMNPDWAREIRDHCVAQGVKFFFKQWGEFLPELKPSGPPVGKEFVEAVAYCESSIRQACGFPGSGTKPIYPYWSKTPEYEFKRVGKHRAGRELDGRTWDEVPNLRE